MKTLAGSMLTDIIAEAIANLTATNDRICWNYDDSTSTNVQAFAQNGRESRLHICLYQKELTLLVLQPRPQYWELKFDLRDPTSLDRLRELFCKHAAHKTTKQPVVQTR